MGENLQGENKVKNSMKICHLTSAHPYNDIRILYKECCSLASEGYEVHLIAPGAPDQVLNNVYLHGVPVSTNRFERMIKTVWNIYKAAQKVEANLYHFHDPELIFLGLLLKIKGNKVIYDVHEDYPRQIMCKFWINKSIRSFVSWTFEKIENFSAKRFDKVIGATPFIKERFDKLRCKSMNVNNYPILTEIKYDDQTWNKKIKAVCYIGAISEERGIYQMVEAIGKTDYKLLLGGQFSPNILRDSIINVPGWEQVEELGLIDRNSVKEVLFKSMGGLVVLHPIINYIDALPIKMFEYMSAGICVIASNFPLWKEIVEGNHCGICVDPMDSQAISEAISWVIDHPEATQKMGENGRKAVEEKYNWETEAIKLFRAYRDLLNGPVVS